MIEGQELGSIDREGIKRAAQRYCDDFFRILIF